MTRERKEKKKAAFDERRRLKRVETERRRESKTQLQQEQELKSRLAAGLPPLARWGGGQGRKEGKGSNVCNNSTANTHTPNKEKSKYENREEDRRRRA